jgi:hypothetical protein
MPRDLDDLIQKYRDRIADKKSPPGSRELAEMEDEIWELRKRIEGSGTTKTAAGERRDWFSTQFGGSAVPYEKRGTILRAGKWAWICFERIDSGVYNYSSATYLIRHVKNIFRRTAINPQIVMDKAVEMFDGTNKSIANLENVVRPKRTTPSPKVNESAAYSSSANASSKEFRARMNHVVASYLEHIFQQNPVHDFYRGQLEDDFMASIDVLIDELRKKIQSSKRFARNEIVTTVSQSDFELACEVLGLSLVYGDSIDDKTERLITRRYQRRAGELHPDKNPGSAARDEYQNVNEAYETMKSYVRIRKEAS